MSVTVMSLVFQARMQTAARNGVMLALADGADHNGKNTFKSRDSISQMADVSARTVTRICADFVAEGLIEEVGFGPKGTVRYHVNLEALKALDPCHHVTPDTMSPLTGDTKPPDTMSPEPSITVNSRGIYREIYDCWNTATLDNGLSPVRSDNLTRRRLIAERLKDYGGEKAMLFEAIGNVGRNPHWLGKNDRGWRADFDWVFRQQNFHRVLEYTPNEKHHAKSTSQARGEKRSADIDAAFEIALRSA